MNTKRKALRYKLNTNGEQIGDFTTIQSIADAVGCSLQLLYKSRNEEGVFSFKNIKYQIIDKLDLI